MFLDFRPLLCTYVLSLLSNRRTTNVLWWWWWWWWWWWRGRRVTVGSTTISLTVGCKSQTASRFASRHCLLVLQLHCAFVLDQELHWTAGATLGDDLGHHPTSCCCPEQNYRRSVTMSSALWQPSSGTIFRQPLPTRRPSVFKKHFSKKLITRWASRTWTFFTTTSFTHYKIQ